MWLRYGFAVLQPVREPSTPFPEPRRRRAKSQTRRANALARWQMRLPDETTTICKPITCFGVLETLSTPPSHPSASSAVCSFSDMLTGLHDEYYWSANVVAIRQTRSLLNINDDSVCLPFLVCPGMIRILPQLQNYLCQNLLAIANRVLLHFINLGSSVHHLLVKQRLWDFTIHLLLVLQARIWHKD